MRHRYCYPPSKLIDTVNKQKAYIHTFFRSLIREWARPLSQPALFISCLAHTTQAEAGQARRYKKSRRNPSKKKKGGKTKVSGKKCRYNGIVKTKNTRPCPSSCTFFQRNSLPETCRKNSTKRTRKIEPRPRCKRKSNPAPMRASESSRIPHAMDIAAILPNAK
jgi:hypothetical protein